MPFSVVERPLTDVLVIEPSSFVDERGFFTETYRQDAFADLGLPHVFVQDNHSGSRRGVLRGLHFQWDPPMGKLMRVTAGTAWLVAVDIRPGSATLGQWFGREVSAENRLQIWAPAGFARGFCALSNWAEVQYKCTGIYNSAAEAGIRWDDPALAIEWPIESPTLTTKDAAAQTLEEWLQRPEAEAFRVSS